MSGTGGTFVLSLTAKEVEVLFDALNSYMLELENLAYNGEAVGHDAAALERITSKVNNAKAHKTGPRR